MIDRVLVLLRLVVWSLFLSEAVAQPNVGRLSVMDFSAWSYRAEISNYGNPLDSIHIYTANIVTPPDDPQLCSFPDSLIDPRTNSTVNVSLRAPIAMLVSLGGCDHKQKARIAASLQQQVTGPYFKYVIFYNNDPNQPDMIQSFQRTESDDIESFEPLAFLSISTAAGTSLLSRVSAAETATGFDSVFLSEDSEEWHLGMVLERIEQGREQPYHRGGASGSIAGSYYWIRFVLFSLLIVSPCFRAGYLWWTGGGRIHLRRDEDGRITGLEHVPPMAYWFTATGENGGEPRSADCLTADQVLALPEIKYRPLFCTEDKNGLGSADAIVELGLDETCTTNRSQDSGLMDIDELNGESNDVEVEAARDTKCTTCSICIEEFESGERLRLLPRCRHAFHTDCIMPWLTERQGCCPLCKTSVIESSNERAGSETSLEHQVPLGEVVDVPSETVQEVTVRLPT